MKRHKSQKEEAAAAAKLEESKDSSQFEIIDTSISKDLVQAKKPEEKKQEQIILDVQDDFEHLS
jgi:hypothetical protein